MIQSTTTKSSKKETPKSLETRLKNLNADNKLLRQLFVVDEFFKVETQLRIKILSEEISVFSDNVTNLLYNRYEFSSSSSTTKSNSSVSLSSKISPETKTTTTKSSPLTLSRKKGIASALMSKVKRIQNNQESNPLDDPSFDEHAAATKTTTIIKPKNSSENNHQVKNVDTNNTSSNKISSSSSSLSEEQLCQELSQSKQEYLDLRQFTVVASHLRREQEHRMFLLLREVIPSQRRLIFEMWSFHIIMKMAKSLQQQQQSQQKSQQEQEEHEIEEVVVIIDDDDDEDYKNNKNSKVRDLGTSVYVAGQDGDAGEEFNNQQERFTKQEKDTEKQEKEEKEKQLLQQQQKEQEKETITASTNEPQQRDSTARGTSSSSSLIQKQEQQQKESATTTSTTNRNSVSSSSSSNKQQQQLLQQQQQQKEEQEEEERLIEAQEIQKLEQKAIKQEKIYAAKMIQRHIRFCLTKWNIDAPMIRKLKITNLKVLDKRVEAMLSEQNWAAYMISRRWRQIAAKKHHGAETNAVLAAGFHDKMTSQDSHKVKSEMFKKPQQQGSIPLATTAMDALCLAYVFDAAIAEDANRFNTPLLNVESFREHQKLTHLVRQRRVQKEQEKELEKSQGPLAKLKLMAAAQKEETNKNKNKNKNKNINNSNNQSPPSPAIDASSSSLTAGSGSFFASGVYRVPNADVWQEYNDKTTYRWRFLFGLHALYDTIISYRPRSAIGQLLESGSVVPRWKISFGESLSVANVSLAGKGTTAKPPSKEFVCFHDVQSRMEQQEYEQQQQKSITTKLVPTAKMKLKSLRKERMEEMKMKEILFQGRSSSGNNNDNYNSQSYLMLEGSNNNSSMMEHWSANASQMMNDTSSFIYNDNININNNENVNMGEDEENIIPGSPETFILRDEDEELDWGGNQQQQQQQQNDNNDADVPELQLPSSPTRHSIQLQEYQQQLQELEQIKYSSLKQQHQQKQQKIKRPDNFYGRKRNRNQTSSISPELLLEEEEEKEKTTKKSPSSSPTNYVSRRRELELQQQKYFDQFNTEEYLQSQTNVPHYATAKSGLTLEERLRHKTVNPVSVMDALNDGDFNVATKFLVTREELQQQLRRLGGLGGNRRKFLMQQQQQQQQQQNQQQFLTLTNSSSPSSQQQQQEQQNRNSMTRTPSPQKSSEKSNNKNKKKPATAYTQALIEALQGGGRSSTPSPSATTTNSKQHQLLLTSSSSPSSQTPNNNNNNMDTFVFSPTSNTLMMMPSENDNNNNTGTTNLPHNAVMTKKNSSSPQQQHHANKRNKNTVPSVNNIHDVSTSMIMPTASPLFNFQQTSPSPEKINSKKVESTKNSSDSAEQSPSKSVARLRHVVAQSSAASPSSS